MFIEDKNNSLKTNKSTLYENYVFIVNIFIDYNSNVQYIFFSFFISNLLNYLSPENLIDLFLWALW